MDSSRDRTCQNRRSIAIELFWFTSDLINANPSHDGPVARQQLPGYCTLTVECKMYSVPVGRSLLNQQYVEFRPAVRVTTFLVRDNQEPHQSEVQCILLTSTIWLGWITYQY